MNRFTQNIKRSKVEASVIILSAGVGENIRSKEPRSLLVVNKEPLIDHQLKVVYNTFDDPDIIVVIGINGNRLIKKLDNNVRIVENQLYETANSFSSLRLAVNNSNRDSMLFFHGDLYFNIDTLRDLKYTKSFVIADSKGQLKKKEVGVTVEDGNASILSYGLPTKWCQIAFFTGLELELLRNFCLINKPIYQTLSSFEIINRVIDKGGEFRCFEPPTMSILEIDSLKDLSDENFDSE